MCCQTEVCFTNTHTSFLSSLFLLVTACYPVKVFQKKKGTSIVGVRLDTVPGTDNTADAAVFEKVEIEASYPGGETAWRRFLEQNLNAAVPANKRAPAGTYTVVIQFVVDKTGKLSDITPLTNHGYGMEEEVIRLLKKAPHWKPAVQEGRVVKAYRKQPVTFVVMEEEKKKKRNRG